MIIFINLHGCGCKPSFIKINSDSDLINQIKKIMKSYSIRRLEQISYKGKKLFSFNEEDVYKDKRIIRQNTILNWKRFYEKVNLIKNFDIKEYDIIDIQTHIVGGGIDNIKDEIDLKIGFDMNLIQRNELSVNLIHFDLKMTNGENYGYYNNFKVNVVGGFYAIDDLNILKNYFEKIKEKNIPFIVISSGTSGKDVISLCKNYSFIKEVIIFCSNYSYNEHYLKEYPGYVKKVFTSINPLYEYIKTLGANNDFQQNIALTNYQNKYNLFSSDEIKMDRQIQQCPVISSSEYDKCYFLIHKSYSHFFGDINNINVKPEFGPENFCKILGLLNLITFNNTCEVSLIEQFKQFLSIKDNNTFVETAIREYTRESNFCYLFNRVMRNIESGLISFAYFMGPFLFGLNKYVKEHPSFAISKDMTLYRNIKCSELDFYLYKINLGHIICFPSLTSTSSQPCDFSATSLSQSVCHNKEEEMLKVKMIFNYKHSQGNISPGIIVEDKKGHDGDYLSKYPGENEVILFPFTFARIKKIEDKVNNGKHIHIIYLEIINRTSYIEYTLKDNVSNRMIFSQLD